MMPQELQTIDADPQVVVARFTPCGRYRWPPATTVECGGGSGRRDAAGAGRAQRSSRLGYRPGMRNQR
ncbi:MAG: hypothetical protein U0935_20470 [Pirellulales bacterium]